MKSALPALLLLFVTITLGVTYWYNSTAYICPVPLYFKVGEYSANFSLSAEEVLPIIIEAEKVWEEGVGRELFTYSPDAEFAINFVFDDRQQNADDQARFLESLDEQKAESDELQEQVDALVAEHEKLKGEYETRKASYDAKLSSYNAKVNEYNQNGGAPPDVFRELNNQQAELGREADNLNRLAGELNQMARDINELSQRGGQLVARYNNNVNSYNERFSEAGAFTQGEFSGDRINVYKFNDTNELRKVLVHEFGHALGIQHVEGPASMMYYLMEEQPDPPILSQYDIDAFKAVCGQGDEWEHRVRLIIRGLINYF